MLSQMIDIFLWLQNVWLKFWLIGCKRKRTLLICHTWLVPMRNRHQISDDVDIFTLLNTFFFWSSRGSWISQISCVVFRYPLNYWPPWLIFFLRLWNRIFGDFKCHLNTIDKFSKEERERLWLLRSVPLRPVGTSSVCPRPTGVTCPFQLCRFLLILVLKLQYGRAVRQIISIPGSAAMVAVHAVMWFRPAEVSLG